MYPPPRSLALLTLAALLLVLAACQPSATAEPEVQVETVVETVVVTQEVAGETVEVIITATPPGPTPRPTFGPTPTPIYIVITSIPAPIIVEDRLVELEWPAQIFMGQSADVRLTFDPETETIQATVTVEHEDNKITTQDLPVKHIPGYEIAAVAELLGIGFTISPEGEQEKLLTPDEPLTWRWTLTPRQAGQQRLSLSLALRWRSPDNPGKTARESDIYSRGLNVEVKSLAGMTRPRAAQLVLLVAALAGGTLLGGWLWARRRRPPAAPRLEIGAPNQTLALEPHPAIQLAPPERPLLQTLFARYGRLLITREFLSGYSGARTFLAQPIRPDGRTDAHTIVKISTRAAMQQEYANYQTFVKDTLPPITARIQRPPVTVKGNPYAAVQYTFIGEPGRTPTSLRQALLADPNPALLEKLFATFGPNWWMQRRPYTFRLAQEYDRKLPTHYVLVPDKGRAALLDGHTPPAQTQFQVDDLVTLRRFPQRELRADAQSCSLEGVAAPGHPALRVRWLTTQPHEGAVGRVIATRQTLLADTVAGFEWYGLPDPLARLPELLNEQVRGTQSTIHGDLNLENVLVGPGEFVWLIDFALTRDGPPLYDFAHLYAEIIAHVLAPRLEDGAAFLAMLDTGDEPLLGALGAIAERCLFNAAEPREDALARYMACVGALKFANLEAHAKHLLYLAAAHIAQTL